LSLSFSCFLQFKMLSLPLLDCCDLCKTQLQYSSMNSFLFSVSSSFFSESGCYSNPFSFRSTKKTYCSSTVSEKKTKESSFSHKASSPSFSSKIKTQKTKKNSERRYQSAKLDRCFSFLGGKTREAFPIIHSTATGHLNLLWMVNVYICKAISRTITTYMF